MEKHFELTMLTPYLYSYINLQSQLFFLNDIFIHAQFQCSGKDT